VKRRAIVIHSLDHALAATAAADVLAVPLTLISAAGAAGYLGAPVFAAIIAETRRAHPAVTLTAILDCGDAPGDALNAIRHGTPVIRIALPVSLRRKVEDIAAQSGTSVDREAWDILDLLDLGDLDAACHVWLADDIGP
jgi:hypothetical protein